MLSKSEETEVLHVQPVIKAKDGPSPIHKEAASLLRQLRVDLKSYRDSPDLQEQAERRMRREASLHIRGCVALNAHLDKHGLQRGPAPAFYFVPSPMPAAISVGPLPPAEGKSEATSITQQQEWSYASKRSSAPRMQRAKAATSTAAGMRDASEKGSPLEQQERRASPLRDGELRPQRLAKYVDPSWAASSNTSTNRAREGQESARTPESLEEDATMESAVRDYLRRINIIGRSDVSPNTVSLFADPLYNGKALCQLVHLIVSTEKSAPLTESGEDVIPVRRHLRVDSIQQNYEAAFTLLNQLQSNTLQPSDLLGVSAHNVFVANYPTPLLRLYVRLIAHYLPPPDRLFATAPLLTWQQSVDSTAPPNGAYSSAVMRQKERLLCSFLVDYQVLPNPHTYQLPADDCLVADALHAPYLTNTPRFVPRQEAPSALYTPSVFPFLSNGTTLCLLAQRLSNKTFAFLSNPRTTNACTANIHKALEVLNRKAPSLFPPRMFDEATREVVCGNSDYVVHLLTCITDMLGITRSAERPPPRSTSSLEGARSGNTGDLQVQKTPATRTTGAAALSAPAGVAETSQRDVAQLQQWLRDLLGKDFVYTAEDSTFTVVGAQVELREPCLIFSDGVVLAHIVRTLERSRCPSLDCVQPSSRVAAKRFSLKKCLRFLQTEKKATFQFLMLDEHLLKGDVWAVVHLLKTIRSIYKT